MQILDQRAKWEVKIVKKRRAKARIKEEKHLKLSMLLIVS